MSDDLRRGWEQLFNDAPEHTAIKAMNALRNAGYQTLAEARDAGPAELVTVKNLGAKGLLAAFGLYAAHARERPISYAAAVRIVTVSARLRELSTEFGYDAVVAELERLASEGGE